MHKCLTTCKQHYQDFRKLGLKAPLEAEFSAYALLAVEIWQPELFELPPDIKRSPEVELAVAARRAIDDSNWVRFFKLFEQAEPIMQCAMHRWFPKLRIAALKYAHHKKKKKNKKKQTKNKQISSKAYFASDISLTFSVLAGF